MKLHIAVWVIALSEHPGVDRANAARIVIVFQVSHNFDIFSFLVFEIEEVAPAYARDMRPDVDSFKYNLLHYPLQIWAKEATYYIFFQKFVVLLIVLDEELAPFTEPFTVIV